jgi:hypothetical protein
LSRQIETIPEYESDIVPNTLPKTQSNNNNNNSRRLPAPNKSSIINTNRTLVKDTQTSSVSQPIPVPTQVQNYEKMQESRERAKRALAGSPSGSPSDGKILKDLYINLLFVY